MDDVTSNAEQKPSEVVAAAAAVQNKVLVTDARGRIIAVHKLTALDYYHLTKALGDSASNTALMDLATTVAGVRRIDTTDFAFPNSEKDVEFAMQLLDFDGLKAAGEGLRKLHAKAADGTEAAKNSQGSPPSG